MDKSTINGTFSIAPEDKNLWDVSFLNILTVLNIYSIVLLVVHSYVSFIPLFKHYQTSLECRIIIPKIWKMMNMIGKKTRSKPQTSYEHYPLVIQQIHGTWPIDYIFPSKKKPFIVYL